MDNHWASIGHTAFEFIKMSLMSMIITSLGILLLKSFIGCLKVLLGIKTATIINNIVLSTAFYKYYKNNRRKIEDFINNSVFSDKDDGNNEINDDELRLVLKYLKKKNKKW